MSFDRISVNIGGLRASEVCKAFPSCGRSFAENTVIITAGSPVPGNRNRLFVGSKGGSGKLNRRGFCLYGQSPGIIMSVCIIFAVVALDCVGIFLSYHNGPGFG